MRVMQDARVGGPITCFSQRHCVLQSNSKQNSRPKTTSCSNVAPSWLLCNHKPRPASQRRIPLREHNKLSTFNTRYFASFGCTAAHATLMLTIFAALRGLKPSKKHKMPKSDGADVCENQDTGDESNEAKEDMLTDSEQSDEKREGNATRVHGAID